MKYIIQSDVTGEYFHDTGVGINYSGDREDATRFDSAIDAELFATLYGEQQYTVLEVEA